MLHKESISFCLVPLFVSSLFCYHRFSFLTPLNFFSQFYFFVSTLSFFCYLIGEGNIKQWRKKSKEKTTKPWQSKNKAATKNMERLGIALLGFHSSGTGRFLWIFRKWFNIKLQKAHVCKCLLRKCIYVLYIYKWNLL